MKIGILITARLGSARLSRKHLKIVNGKPIIHFLIQRIYNNFKEEIEAGSFQIIISTGRSPINKDFESLSDYCSVFYGNDENIPLRHLETARDYELDAIVSIDGDDILCSTTAMRQVSDALSNGKKMVKTTGLPLGMNVMGYRSDFLAQSLENFKNSSLENGWGRIFDKSGIHDVVIDSYDHEDLRFTLDYDLDFAFFSKIIQGLDKKILSIKDDELIDYVVKNNIYEINAPIAKEYWENFNKNLDSEKISNKEA